MMSKSPNKPDTHLWSHSNCTSQVLWELLVMLIPLSQHQSNDHNIFRLRPLRHCNTPKCLTPASVMAFSTIKLRHVKLASVDKQTQPIICNILHSIQMQGIEVNKLLGNCFHKLLQFHVLPSRLQHCGGSCCPLGPMMVHQPQGLHRLQQTISTILWLFQETFDWVQEIWRQTVPDPKWALFIATTTPVNKEMKPLGSWGTQHNKMSTSNWAPDGTDC